MLLFFFMQKTAYVMRISDCSADWCSSDLEQADDDGACHRREDRSVDDPHPPVGDAQLGDNALMLDALGVGPTFHQNARPVDDAREPPRDNVEQAAGRHQQEYWRDRQLNRLRNRTGVEAHHPPAATDGVFTPCIARNLRTLRAARRMRCSFSTLALRT